MAKTKADLHREAVAAGAISADSNPDDFTTDELQAYIGGNLPAWKGSLSATKPVVAPDGHVNLSQEDIDARDG